jgi:hypothetical protein
MLPMHFDQRFSLDMQVMAFGSLQLKAILGNTLHPVRHHALPNCWMRRGTVEPFDDVNRPSGILTLRFDNNIVMTLLPKNYLIRVVNL